MHQSQASTSQASMRERERETYEGQSPREKEEQASWAAGSHEVQWEAADEVVMISRW